MSELKKLQEVTATLRQQLDVVQKQNADNLKMRIQYLKERNVERERCARIAETICQHPKGMWKCEVWEAAKLIAEEIRKGK